MAFYENKREHYGGALVLFQRNLAVAVPNSKSHRLQTWYMRLKIGGRKGYVTRSTKITIYEDAYEFAKSELLRLQQAARLGHSLDEYTFEKHWNDWYERNLRNGTWKTDRARWHKMYFNRYFKDYFSNADKSSMLLNDITAQYAAGYWDWRKSYWSTAKAVKLQSYNPKRRSAKTLGTANAKKTPALKTLQMEQSALNQIFYDAMERGRMQQIVKMRVAVNGQTQNRRAGFDTASEYLVLVRNLRSYRDCVGRFASEGLNAWHKLHRAQLSYFVMFLLHSGLRVGEAREMRWSDIKFDIEVEGEEERIAEVRVSKATKKGQARFVQAQTGANNALKEWRKISPHKLSSDLVWFGQKTDAEGKATQISDLNKSFQQYLRAIAFDGRQHGLLNDRDGDRRSLYSLRHTYATLRLEKGDVSVYDLSINMGCKVKQIETHYSHVVSKQRRQQITRTNRKKVAVDTGQGAMMQNDAFMAEALRRYKMGELSDEAFLAIAKGQAR
ncbi:Phage integrase family protein [Pseudorhodobacter antarcticus]|uniref:Phage integrase family protein n=1 Tax=Pseudorhodobacter antarcticus TaxID=1077947 RepID=A0A1H8KWT0_9RHOB|nr:site-specific integrase [Pseudorhodobacter antarcticus]SEN97400.1 Phage integrase family protein [Pseudorhodobacter antarcticus]